MKADPAGEPAGPASASNFDEAQRLVLKALLARPSALVTDLDGTLSPIAPTPEEATVLAECREALERLCARLDLVTVLSGRRAQEARDMVGLDGLTYFGNHGLERWDRATGLRDETERFHQALAETKAEVDREVRAMNGVRLEDKLGTISVHYRLSPDPEDTRRTLLNIIRTATKKRRLIITEGKKVIEIRPPLGIDKGSVVRKLVEARHLNGLAYFGDDRTDFAAFQAVREMRRVSSVAGVNVGVRGTDASDDLTSLTDVSLEGPAEVGTFLEMLASSLER